jgi:hypothetical protein
MTPKEQKINALQFELSRRFDAARVAQNALMAEQRRQGLPCTREFYTADEWAAERIAERIELREIVRATICDVRYRCGDPTYRPDAMHRSLIALGKHFAEEAKQKAKATTGNVIPLRATEAAQQIVAAAKEARGET